MTQNWKASMLFSFRKLIYTSVKAEAKINEYLKKKKKNVKKLTQTKAGVALDNCDSPFKIAPWGQCFLVNVFCWFSRANLLVLEGDNSTQLFVKVNENIRLYTRQSTRLRRKGRCSEWALRINSKQMSLEMCLYKIWKVSWLTVKR